MFWTSTNSTPFFDRLNTDIKSNKMSQGFTAVNLPREEDAPVGSLAMTLHKEEDMEDDVGDADATEVSSSIVLSCHARVN